MKKSLLHILLPLAILGGWMYFKSSPPLGVKPGVQMGAVFPEKLQDSDGNDVSSEALRGKYVGVYFSAHWCPPCRIFTPQLVKFRNENAGNGFEVVFVSADFSLGEKENYIREAGMKWLSVPGVQGPENQKLEERFKVPGYPTLIILSPEGTVVSNTGVEDLMIAPEKALAKWTSL